LTARESVQQRRITCQRSLSPEEEGCHTYFEIIKLVVVIARVPAPKLDAGAMLLGLLIGQAACGVLVDHAVEGSTSAYQRTLDQKDCHRRAGLGAPRFSAVQRDPLSDATMNTTTRAIKA
jgi:hypothetical protein